MWLIIQLRKVYLKTAYSSQSHPYTSVWPWPWTVYRSKSDHLKSILGSQKKYKKARAVPKHYRFSVHSSIHRIFLRPEVLRYGGFKLLKGRRLFLIIVVLPLIPWNKQYFAQRDANTTLKVKKIQRIFLTKYLGTRESSERSAGLTVYIRKVTLGQVRFLSPWTLATVQGRLFGCPFLHATQNKLLFSLAGVVLNQFQFLS